MNIKYLYIEGYKDIIDSLDLNFGSEYIYSYRDKKLFKYPNKEYVHGFYKNYSCIEQITAIIGENGSGKTTILKIISEILSGDTKSFNFIIVFNYKNSNYMSTNIDGIKDNDIENINISKIKSKCVIFYSSIFDKSSILSNYRDIVDISTNNILRKYLKDYYKNEEKSNNSSNKNKKIDIIDKFKEKEALRISKYIKRLNKINEDEDEFKPLFKSPQYVSISYADDSKIKLELIENVNNISGEKLSTLNDILDDIILEELQENSDIKQKYKNEFIAMLLFEIFYKIQNEFDKDIDSLIDSLFDKIDSLEEKLCLDKIIIEILNEMIKIEVMGRKPDSIKDTILYDDDYLGDNIENQEICSEDIENLQEISKLLVEIIENVKENKFNKIDEISELVDKVDVNIQKYIDEEYKSDINDFIEDVKTYVKIFKDYINYEIQDINIEELIEEIQGNISYLNYYFELNQENLLRDNSEYKTIKLNEKEIYDEKQIYNELINTNNYDILSEFIDYNYLSFVEEVKSLINLKMDIINKNSIEKDEYEILNLQANWSDYKVINYISSFESLGLKTIDIIINHEDLSSGQNAYLDMLSRVLDIEEQIKSKKDILFLIDECDINLHPEMQIKFINNLLKFLNIFFPKKKFHIILTSNSPFIISDIPNTNIIYIENEEKIQITKNDISNIKTFGASINELLINSFFMKSITGEFSRERINNIIKDIRNGKADRNEQEFIIKNIELIGDSLIRNKLKEMFIDIYGTSDRQIDEEISKLERKISQLKRMKKND